MTISATAVRFDEHTMWVDLTDGRTLGVPLAWFPRLLQASPDTRARVEISRVGLHWEDLDEDISIAGLLAGRSDMTRQTRRVIQWPRFLKEPQICEPFRAARSCSHLPPPLLQSPQPQPEPNLS